MSEATTNNLRNRRVLVVEDEYMIADEVAEMLSEEGVEVLGPAGSIIDALRLVAIEGRIDGALLDVSMRGQRIWPVVDALRARSVPLVLTTGYDASVIPAAYSDLPRCEKPSTKWELVRALSYALSG